LINNLNGTSDFVIPNFETILKEIDIKPEFFIDFEYNEENKTFLLDLDLPEIENIPEKTASILQSGKLSVKTKSEKQIKEDYAKCVTGLGFLISGITFMASVGIENVVISAYTQRINNADGLEKDDYIYSIEFNRETFSKINYSKFEPIEAFKNFNHEMNLSKYHIFKTIIPTPN